MENDGAATPQTHECPRCGYDLSGIMDCWQDCCPLEGRCSECGTEFRWADVMDPRRLDLRGFVEHARGFREVIRWSFITASWIARPWVFWKIVRVEHRTVTSRMVLWFAGWLVFFHTCAATLGFVSRQLQQRVNVPSGQSFSLQAMLWDLLGAFAFPFAAIRGTARGPMVQPLRGYEMPAYIMPALVFSIVFPILLVAIPVTRRRASLKWEHLARAFIFGFAWVIPLAIFRLVRNAVYIAQLLAEQGTMAANAASGWTAFPRGAGPLTRPYRLSEFVPELLGPLLFAWLLAWWYHACIRGWKLHGGRIVWALLAIAVGVVVEIVLHAPELAEYWLGWP